MSTAYLRCIEESCREQFPLDYKEHKCERCGNLLDVHYDFRALALPRCGAYRIARAARAATDVGAAQSQHLRHRPERRLALS